jgi:hypothetical protein
MLSKNTASRNGFAYSPVVDAPYAMRPESSGSAPAVYPPCPSDYPAVSPKAALPKWRDEHPKYVHSMEWHDSLGIKHMLVFRDDDLDEVLREARMIREFVKAARARDEKPESTRANTTEAAPEAAPASDTPASKVWCERHACWSYLRTKNGHSWFSHKDRADGSWCRRAAK